jgi:phosphoglycolate phosphatase-like HAD superfamily hydrolase
VPPAPLIFDLDDTLIESFPTYARLHQRVAEEMGLPVPSREALVAYGATWEATLAALWPEANLESFMRRYDEIANDHPYPAINGAVAALTSLRAVGHSLWIVTKRSRRRLYDRLAQAGLPVNLFEGIYPAELQPRIKPHPDCFAPVWAAMGRQDPEAVYVGDRHEDRAAAEGAGIGFYAVLTGPEVTVGFPGDLADHAIISSVAELPGRLSVSRGGGA